MYKKLFIRRIHDFFDTLKTHDWYMRLINLPLFMRALIAVGLIIIGILGIILPILPGAIFLFLAVILIIGIHRTKRLSLKTIYLTRLHIIFSHIYSWWKRR